MDDDRNADRRAAPEHDPRSTKIEGAPLTVDKETLKDISPNASDQEAVRGGARCVHTGSNCP
jgi:hypothetical protein